jgi:molecular chaperone Hsp33
MSGGDLVLRAITQDGAFRVITATTTSSTSGVVQAQNAKGAAAKILAELLTGTVIMREAMAPDWRVQGILQIGRGRMVADAYPDGSTRGLVQERGGGALDPSRGGMLQLMRSMPGGHLQQGFVEVASGGVSSALMEYMQSSEQISAFVSVAAVVDGDDVTAAGGFLVQLLPEVDRGPLMVMTERLADMTPLEQLLRSGDASPQHLMEELLYAMPFELVGKCDVRFECPCDESRVLTSLATLPRTDIQEMIDEARVLEIECDYCHREYKFAPERLRGLLDAS